MKFETDTVFSRLCIIPNESIKIASEKFMLLILLIIFLSLVLEKNEKLEYEKRPFHNRTVFEFIFYKFKFKITSQI